MKTTRLSFNQLNEELEVLQRSNLKTFKGGSDIQWGEDAEGNVYWRDGDNGAWNRYVVQLDTVVINGTAPQSLANSYNYNDYLNGGGSIYGVGGSGIFGGGSFSNFTDWEEALAVLANLSSLGEMGAYGANNLKAAEAFGKLGIAATVGGVALDANELNNYYTNGNGNMDGIRFSIRTGGAASSILAGSLIGGPEGLLAGIPIAGAVFSFEEMYDIVQNWIQKVSQGSADFSNAISRGWIPGYN